MTPVKGDRVKLTERAAHTVQQGCIKVIRNRYPDWANRRGVVMHTPKTTSGCVRVLWDDRTTSEPYPKGMIEKGD